MKTIIFLSVVLFVATACMSEKDKMLKQGHSLNYSQGYDDGCNTGHGEAGMFASFKKNPKLSKTSNDYRRGWKDGRLFCGNQSRSNLQQNAMMYHYNKQ